MHVSSYQNKIQLHLISRLYKWFEVSHLQSFKETFYFFFFVYFSPAFLMRIIHRKTPRAPQHFRILRRILTKFCQEYVRLELWKIFRLVASKNTN